MEGSPKLLHKRKDYRDLKFSAAVQAEIARSNNESLMSPRSNAPVVAIVGSLNVDFITRTKRLPEAGETLTAISFDIGFGGKGANQAVACGRLSRRKPKVAASADASTDHSDETVNVRMIGAVGDDSFADDFIRSLQADGIDTTGVVRLPKQKTGIANIIVEDESGENRILLAPNANYARPGEVDLVPDDADVVVFQLEIPLEQVLYNMKKAHAANQYVLLNPAPAQVLPDDAYENIDCLVVNETEAATLSQLSGAEARDIDRVATGLLDRGVRHLVVVTLGAKGVYYISRSNGPAEARGTFISACKAKVVDTTAAGDTFVGASAVFIARAKDRTLDPREGIEFANRAAARTVEKPGAMAAIPWLDEV
ncbi:putative ribokinase [Elasticomyces elasticus]|nr:putative ribokinase [Elasticomyces elasticus]